LRVFLFQENLHSLWIYQQPGDEKLMRRAQHRQQIAGSPYRGVAQCARSVSHFQVAEDTKPVRRRAR